MQRPSRDPTYKSASCEAACLTAFGAIGTVNVIDMRSEARRAIKIIKRPPVCYERAIPSLSWGYGVSPSDKSRSKPLLAIGWDKVIKLMSLDDDAQDLQNCGYYISEIEIN